MFIVAWVSCDLKDHYEIVADEDEAGDVFFRKVLEGHSSVQMGSVSFSTDHAHYTEHVFKQPERGGSGQLHVVS